MICISRQGSTAHDSVRRVTRCAFRRLVSHLSAECLEACAGKMLALLGDSIIPETQVAESVGNSCTARDRTGEAHRTPLHGCALRTELASITMFSRRPAKHRINARRKYSGRILQTENIRSLNRTFPWQALSPSRPNLQCFREFFWQPPN